MTRLAPQRLTGGVLAALLLAGTRFLAVAVLAQGGAVSNPGDQYSDVGATVSVAVSAADMDGDTTNVPVFTTTGLPPGVTAGAPALSAGVATIALAGAPTTAGIYPVTVTVADGAAAPQTVAFTWNVTEWQVGDIFAGVGARTYLRFSPAGVPAGSLVIQPHAGETSFTTDDTAGCAVDWRTGDLYTTNFSSGTYRVAGAPSADGTHATLDFYDSDRPEDVGGQAGLYVDQLPESVVLSHDGFFVGHADGYFGVDGNLPTDDQNQPLYADTSLGGVCDCMIDSTGKPILDINGNQFSSYNEYAVGLYFVDAAGDVMTDGSGAYLYYGAKDANGKPYILDNPSPGDPYWDRFTVLSGAFALEPFLEQQQGVPYLGQDGKPIHTRLQWGADIQVRNLQGTRLSKEDGIYGIQGTDWVDLASDQRTLFYTSEYGVIYRYDLQTHSQLPPFGYLGPNNRAYALRVLPPGDGTGGLLVAETHRIVRLDGNGQIVQEYQVPAEFDATAGNPQWFALNITPDATAFWTASLLSGNLYEFDIVTGKLLQGPVATGAAPYFLGGMCVKREYTAAQEICGNGIDDDGDGLIDENCTALPICSEDPGNPACDRPPTAPDFDADVVYEDSVLVRPEPGAEIFLRYADDPDCDATSCDVDNLRVTILGAPAHGTMTLTVDGTVYPVTPATVAAGLSFAYDNPYLGNPGGTTVVETYTPDPDYCGGSDSIPYRVTDPKGVSAEGVYTIRQIICVNDPPVAVADTAQTNEDAPVTVPVVANDTDREGNAITVASVTQPAHGTVTFDATTATYTPAPDFFGTDTFTYTATDNQPVDPNAPPQGTPGQSTATVTITVNPVNDPPSFTKGPDETAFEDAGPQTFAGWATNLSAGPANEAGQTLTFLVTTTNAALFSAPPAISPAGTLTFQSAPDANGSATVSVRVQDNGGTANGGVDTSPVQTFTITVTPVNDPPVAAADTAQTNEDAPVTVPVVANDTDAEGNGITVSSVTQPAHGTVTFGPTTVTYTPAPDFFGTDTFTYTATDGQPVDPGAPPQGTPGQSTATVTITVNPVNDPPSFTRGPDETVPEDAGPQTIPGWATNLSAGPANETGQTLTFLVTTTNPALFSAAPAIDPAGTLTFQSAPNANGSATVSVRARDDGGTANGGVDTSPVQTFTITVTPVNDPPVAAADAYTVLGQTLTVPAAQGVLSNDTDVDGDALSATVLTGPTGGTLQLGADGSFTYTAYPGTTADAFTYTASDGHGGSASAAVTLTVIANQPPVCSAAVAAPAALWPPDHKLVPIAIDGVTDPDGNTITLTITGIRQDEPTNTEGDGNTAVDGFGVGTGQASVRAERAGDPKHPGNGRVYHIAFTASDGLASCSGEVTVGVPHDQGHGPAVDDGPIYDSTVPFPPLVSDDGHGRRGDGKGKDDDKAKGGGKGKDDGKGKRDAKDRDDGGWMKDSDWQHGRDGKGGGAAGWTSGWQWKPLGVEDHGPWGQDQKASDGKKDGKKDEKKDDRGKGGKR